MRRSSSNLMIQTSPEDVTIVVGTQISDFAAGTQ